MKNTTEMTPYRWAIVSGSGTDDEQVIAKHSNFKAAKKTAKWFIDMGTFTELEVMLQLPDGKLTAEF